MVEKRVSDHTKESTDHIKESTDHIKESMDHIKSQRTKSMDHMKESTDQRERRRKGVPQADRLLVRACGENRAYVGIA